MLEGLLRDDDEVVCVWYLMGWLHVLTKDRDSAHFYLEQASKVSSQPTSPCYDCREILLFSWWVRWSVMMSK